MQRHAAQLFTPPSFKLVLLPNAPLRSRKRFPKKHLQPRKLSYEYQQDTYDYKMADEAKNVPPVSRGMLDTKESMLRNKSLQVDNKENQEYGKSRPRHVAKEGERKGSSIFHQSNPKPEQYIRGEFVHLRI